jgi:lipoprotein-anchoring transpeptidase ErfK/SrfK
LQVNPESPRARKGMQWALKRLQEVPPEKALEQTVEQKKTAEATKQVKAVKRNASAKKSRWGMLFPGLLLILGCMVLLLAAWTASASPVLASLLVGTSQPVEAQHPRVWARVEIAKPAQAADPAPVFVDVQPTLPPPTPTLLPTLEPTAAPTQEQATATHETEATAIPAATDTPAGSLVMEIVENTPAPTAGPTDANAPPKPQSPPVGNGVRWIEVNLSEQRMYAWEGDVLMNSFLVSTGTWATPTVTGTFSIWHKTPLQAMSGPGYYLPNVPYVMYFYKDYGIHGTYWHNNFGTPMSHGCVNLTIPDSEWLYNWASYGTTVKVHY